MSVPACLHKLTLFGSGDRGIDMHDSCIIDGTSSWRKGTLLKGMDAGEDHGAQLFNLIVVIVDTVIVCWNFGHQCGVTLTFDSNSSQYCCCRVE